MASSFASIETSINAATLAALGNVTFSATGSGITATGLAGIFMSEYHDSLGLASSSPSLRCEDSDIVGLVAGDAVTVTYGSTTTNYTVRELHPDGAGLTTMVLRAA